MGTSGVDIPLAAGTASLCRGRSPPGQISLGTGLSGSARACRHPAPPAPPRGPAARIRPAQTRPAGRDAAFRPGRGARLGGPGGRSGRSRVRISGPDPAASRPSSCTTTCASRVSNRRPSSRARTNAPMTMSPRDARDHPGPDHPRPGHRGGGRPGPQHPGWSRPGCPCLDDRCRLSERAVRSGRPADDRTGLRPGPATASRPRRAAGRAPTRPATTGLAATGLAPRTGHHGTGPPGTGTRRPPAGCRTPPASGGHRTPRTARPRCGPAHRSARSAGGPPGSPAGSPPRTPPRWSASCLVLVARGGNGRARGGGRDRPAHDAERDLGDQAHGVAGYGRRTDSSRRSHLLLRVNNPIRPVSSLGNETGPPMSPGGRPDDRPANAPGPTP